MIYKMFQIYQDVKPQSEQPDHCWMYICIHQCILTGNRWWNGFYTELPPYVFSRFTSLHRMVAYLLFQQLCAY